MSANLAALLYLVAGALFIITDGSVATAVSFAIAAPAAAAGDSAVGSAASLAAAGAAGA